MFVCNTKQDWLKDAIDSILNQIFLDGICDSK